MYLRLSNQKDWAAEFSAASPKELEKLAKKTWAELLSEFGLHHNEKLFLQVLVDDLWVTSGQYRLDGKANLPPSDHEISRTPANNDWEGLFMAAFKSRDHAKNVHAMFEWAGKGDTPEEKRAKFRIVNNSQSSRPKQ